MLMGEAEWLPLSRQPRCPLRFAGIQHPLALKQARTITALRAWLVHLDPVPRPTCGSFRVAWPAFTVVVEVRAFGFVGGSGVISSSPFGAAVRSGLIDTVLTRRGVPKSELMVADWGGSGSGTLLCRLESLGLLGSRSIGRSRRDCVGWLGRRI